jgi:hypothetical protein
MSGVGETLDTLVAATGALAASLVETGTGGCVVAAGAESGERRRRAVAHAARVFRAQVEFAAENAGEPGAVEEAYLVFQNEYHLIASVPGDESARFVLLSLRRDQTNLALARHRLLTAVSELEGQTSEVPPAAPETPSLRSLLSYDEDEELPPFMREENVRRLLGMKDIGTMGRVA